MTVTFEHVCILTMTLFVGDICLASGFSLAGREEIHLKRESLQVCGYTWDLLDAAITCRQLGFSVVVTTYSCASQRYVGYSFVMHWKHGMKCIAIKANGLTASRMMIQKLKNCVLTVHKERGEY